jgi:hypothetical protein
MDGTENGRDGQAGSQRRGSGRRGAVRCVTSGRRFGLCGDLCDVDGPGLLYRAPNFSPGASCYWAELGRGPPFIGHVLVVTSS